MSEYTKSCVICGKTFNAPHSKPNQQCCSRTCGHALRSKNTTRTNEERAAHFWSRVDKLGDGDACWIWTGAKDSYGYGQMRWGKRTVLCSRISWLLTFGDPDGAFVLHTCDNPACVRPDHLFLGTHLENMRDMDFKGRRAMLKGERHPNAKLTVADVKAIRTRSADGDTTYRQIAKEYGVLPSTIGRIVARKLWPHVD